jgi:two-component system, OmpR family, alkaline phosphatase synthesis response regulator PhoP
MTKNQVLIIDDEKDLLELVSYNLKKEGFSVLSAMNGETGLAMAQHEKPDIFIIDLMLPGIDGLEVCRALRASPRTTEIPIIMLTAKSEEVDRIIGLELGADDYISKPFSTRELIARIKAVLRRSSMNRAAHPDVIRLGELTINIAGREVQCSGEPIALTATEFRLLHFFAKNPDCVFSRDQLIDNALGQDISVLDRTIDVHITSLRKKLGSYGKWIETVRGFGYRFREK